MNAGPVDITALKSSMRREFKTRRRAAATANPGAAEMAMERFLAAIPFTPKIVVSAYRPIQNELDPTPLMMALHQRGLRLGVPVIEGPGRALTFRQWTPGCAMMEGPFRAEIPTKGATLEPDLLIMPLLAWDRAGWRLGYGGGFYDRTLEMLRARRPTRAIAYAYGAQEVEAVPVESTDQRLDAVVTEAEVIAIA